MKIEDIAQIPPDPPLAEEMSDDDVIFEMANLDKSQTGIDGFDFYFDDRTCSESEILRKTR
jgi:hypothetical protein